MEALWRIEMLGGLRVTCGARVVSRFRTRKTGLLLAYLALHPRRAYSRDELIDLFWPDADPLSARISLRVALSSLRQALEPPGTTPDPLLLAEATCVRLNPAAVTTDVSGFEAALRAAGDAGDDATRLALLDEAIALFAGELLPGAYDDWVLRERGRLTAACLEALDALAACRERGGDLAGALEAARRAVATDPLREEGHRSLIRLLIVAGQGETARRQYEEMERRLAAGLSAAPSPETRALVEALPPREHAAPSSPDRPSPAHLPSPIDRFFGREMEIAALQGLLGRETPDGPRLVTLTGPGGSGKTRLALEAAAGLRAPFAGAAWFVPLADLADWRRIPERIRDVMRLTGDYSGAPIEQVIFALSRQPALLLLDNCEHLLPEGARLVKTLLEGTETLRVLATSRRRMDLPGERIFPVMPLPVPTDDDRPTTKDERPGMGGPGGSLVGRPSSVVDCPSVQLFLDRARAAQPDFGITPGNAAQVAALCRRLEGLPLALELAASRIGVLSPAQMLARLEERFALLASPHRAADPRHRSLRAALAWSYELLSPAAQRFFARLSVFRGGWTLEAAEAVGAEDAGALDLLSELRCSSLVLSEERGEEVRFRMLETIREYGQECLMASGEAEAARRRHARYFLALAEEADSKLRRAERREWLRRLSEEHPNLRAALAWSVEASDGDETAIRLAGALTWYWESRVTEGREWLAAALARSAPTQRTQARAKALFGAGYMAWIQTDLAPARSLLEEAVAIFRALGDRSGLAVSLTHLAWTAFDGGDSVTANALLEEGIPLSHETAERWNLVSSLLCLAKLRDPVAERACYEEALAIAREIGDPTPVAWSLLNLGGSAESLGNHAEARALVEESVAIFRHLGDKVGLGRALVGLGVTAHLQHDREVARSCWEESVPIRHETGDRAALAAQVRGVWLIARDQGDHEAARSLGEQALAISRQLGDRSYIARALCALGYVAHARGDSAEARVLLEESLAIYRSLDNRGAVARTLAYLAEAADAMEDRETALAAVEEAVTIFQDMATPRYLNDIRDLAYTLLTMGRVAGRRGDSRRAAALFRESLDLYRTLARFQVRGTERRVAECLEGLAAVAAEDLLDGLAADSVTEPAPHPADEEP